MGYQINRRRGSTWALAAAALLLLGLPATAPAAPELSQDEHRARMSALRTRKNDRIRELRSDKVALEQRVRELEAALSLQTDRLEETTRRASSALAIGLCGDPCAIDSDGDGTGDCEDACPCDPSNADGDGDGTPDCADACLGDPVNACNDPCALDSDGDGIDDCSDFCPDDPENTCFPLPICLLQDDDGDGTPDCPDTDGDGVPDIFDPCPDDPADACNDPCLRDSDGDGTVDCEDTCPNDPGGEGDADGDGIIDCEDPCPDDAGNACVGFPECLAFDLNGDGIPGNDCPDSDGDGVPDFADPCPDDPTDACNDPCTRDSDGDGTIDCEDACPADPNDACVPFPLCLFIDSNGDGIVGNDCPDDGTGGIVDSSQPPAPTRF